MAYEATGWRRWLYSTLGTLDVDEWISYWHYRDFLFPFLRSLESPRILDAGCGAGLWSFYLAKHLPTSQVVGIDVRSEAIDLCSKMKLAKSVANVQFYTLAFADLDFEQEFDVIISFYSLHYSYRRDVDVLRAFGRALRPGGALMIIVPVAQSPTRVKDHVIQDETLAQVKYGITVDTRELHDHYRPDELTEKLSLAGFDSIEVCSSIGWLGRTAKKSVAAAPVSKFILWPLAFVLGWLDHRVPTTSGAALSALPRKP